MLLTKINDFNNIHTSLAAVAQLVERRTENPYVVSPILTGGKVRTTDFSVVLFFT